MRMARALIAALAVLAVSAAALLGWRGPDPAVATDPPTDRLGQAAALAADGSAVALSGAGDVIKDLGETGELVDAATGAVAFSITVDLVDVVTSCPGRTDAPVTPERGRFAVFQVTASAAADLEPGSAFPLLEDSFTVQSTNGLTGGPTAAAWLCYEPDERVDAFIGPGDTTSGYVVMDVAPGAHGLLVYAPGGQDGWAWRF